MGVMGDLIELESALDVLEEESNDPAKVQEKLLCRILRDNLHTQYLQRFGVSAANSKNDFKELVPIITYEDVKADIQRIAAGDKSPILSAEAVAEFFISSGTSSGEHKLYPKPADYLERSNIFKNIGTALLYKHLPALKTGQKLQFIYFRKPGSTPCGLISRSAMTSICQKIVSSKDYSNFMLSPREVILYPDFFQSTYCQLLCGLIRRPEVVDVATIFASTLVRIILLLEVCWVDICEDLESGQLNAKIADISVREAMARVLRPYPELASSIRAECSKNSWQGIIRRLWPNTMIIETIVTGSMQQYIPTIDYYSDGIQIVSLRYSSSEAFLGINTNPLCSPREITYMLSPSTAFFEFLPVDRSIELVKEELNSEKRIIAPHGQDVVDLTDVKLGKEYELVVTTPTGLYRYRVGDILKVEGYYNATPTFSFVCRQNVLLSIHNDKTDEKDLHHAVTTAAASCKQTVRDYSSYVELQSNPPHYVIFWEVAEMRCELGVEMEAEEEEVKEWCGAMEESLNSAYRSGRQQGAIGALEIRVVKKGSFERVMELCGGNAAQVKVPKCLPTPSPLLEALQEGVFLKAFSSRLPFYSPNVTLVP